MARSREHLQSLERGLQVLERLNASGFATTATIARDLGLKRSTVHRMLGVLVALGIVHHDRGAGLYSLTSRVLDLSRRTNEVIGVATPAGYQSRCDADLSITPTSVGRAEALDSMRALR